MGRRKRRRSVRTPLTREEFINDYSGAKRRVYTKADRQLREKPVHLNEISRIKCFIKCEPIKKDPRLISTRDPRFHMEFGRHIKVFEKDVYEDINYLFFRERKFDDKLPTVLKGLNQSQRGKVIKQKWDRFDSPIFVGLDVSRFDAHVSTAMLQIEAQIYSGRSSDAESEFSFNQLLGEIFENRGHYFGRDGHISYRIDGSRASGDMNTSLGNCTVMCCMLYSYLDSKNLLQFVEVIDDGDDAGIFLEADMFHKGVLGDMDDFYRNMGFTLKIEDPAAAIEDVEFCQCHPVFTPSGYLMCPNPFRRLYTDLISDKPLQNLTTWRKWVGAVAGCGLATTAGMPVFQEFYSWLARSAGMSWMPKREDGFYYRYRNELADEMSIKKLPISDKARDSFARAYGLSPNYQISLERKLKSKMPLQYSSEEIVRFFGNVLQPDLPTSVTSIYSSLENT